MTEPRADYVTAAADAMQQESRDVNLAANELLGKIGDMNSPERPAYFWRCVVQRVYERLGEVHGGPAGEEQTR